MLTEPDDLDQAQLEPLLERGWGLREPQLEYVRVGFGSHHWRATDARGVHAFVSVDDLEAGFQAGPDADAAYAALERAFRTAASLRDDAGLEFVVAPLADREGAVIRRVDSRYALRVAPLIEGVSATFGPYETAVDRRLMGGVLGRLHAATRHVPDGLPRGEDFALPARGALTEALADRDRPWTSGPFAEPTRRLLGTTARALEARLRDYDALVARVHRSSDRWVVTHGEPHRANVIRGAGGAVHLVDWDTTLLAPRERDLRFVLDDDLTGWDEYVAVSGPAVLNRDAMTLYERWWNLADVATFVADFRRRHERTEQTSAAFETLEANLSSV